MSADTYATAIRGLGVKVIASIDLGHYQGDWVALLDDSYDGRGFAFLVIGYGSCSGCDEWEAAGGASERARLIAKLLDEAKYFEEFSDAQAYIADGHARDLEWYGHEEGWADFQARVAAADEYTRESAESS